MSEEEKEFYGDEEHFLLEYDDEIEELKADIEEYRDSTTWWSNRFNAVERNNRELRQEIERLKEQLNDEIEEELKQSEIMVKKQQEIERLNNLLKETSQILSEQTTKAITLKSENERLNNIIKEAIELINEYKKIIEDGSNKGADYVYINSPYIKLQEIEQILGSDKE